MTQSLIKYQRLCKGSLLYTEPQVLHLVCLESTEYQFNTEEEILSEEVGHIDARFFSGEVDTSELPGAYKNANEMIRQIEKYN